jgi:hypothetical protein
MNVRTVVHDCLYLNWAFPVGELPPLPEPLRYQVKASGGVDYAFGSALLFHHDSIRVRFVPFALAHPQLNLRLYVLDGESCPSVFFQRMLMPAWMAAGVWLLTRQPAASASLHFPRPSQEAAAESWHWRAERGGELSVKASLGSPMVAAGPKVGDWDETVRFFTERPRGYGCEGSVLHRIDASHRPGDVWPVRAELGPADLLSRLLPLSNGHGASPWPPLHSAWINPEMRFSFSFSTPESAQVVHAVPHPAAGRVATAARRETLEP